MMMATIAYSAFYRGCPFCRWGLGLSEAWEAVAILDNYLLLPHPLSTRSEVEKAIAHLKDSRLNIFVEWAGLGEESAYLDDEAFRERVLQLRYHLAEPDKPSKKLIQRLKAVSLLHQQIVRFLEECITGEELYRALEPICSELAAAAPELHPLLYSIAEQMSLVGEHSPEPPAKLNNELRRKCCEWLCRLHSYWHALLG